MWILLFLCVYFNCQKLRRNNYVNFDMIYVCYIFYSLGQQNLLYIFLGEKFDVTFYFILIVKYVVLYDMFIVKRTRNIIFT